MMILTPLSYDRCCTDPKPDWMKLERIDYCEQVKPIGWLKKLFS